MPLACRSCGEPVSQPFLSLGDLPLVDRLISPCGPTQPEPKFPLDVVLCEQCGLVQITETVSPDLLFCDGYPYFSSYSRFWLEHAQKYAETLIHNRQLNSDDLVVEIASNDGYLLKYFHQAGIQTLGIDPAEGPASISIKRGIPTLKEFFCSSLASKLADTGQFADVIIANNVLAHVADLNGFVAGMATLLKPDGLITIEVPYLYDLVQKSAFDTIYHEHLCYFSVTALNNLFQRHHLYLNRIERLGSHGGSVRLFVEKKNLREETVDDLIHYELSVGMTELEYFSGLSSDIRLKTEALRELIDELCSSGKRIAAYGAAAKGVILLHVAKINNKQIMYVADRNPFKQGNLMPGCHIPIVSPQEILDRTPDYLLILPWNLKDEIIDQESVFRAQGGKFIIPLPHLQII